MGGLMIQSFMSEKSVQPSAVSFQFLDKRSEHLLNFFDLSDHVVIIIINLLKALNSSAPKLTADC